MISIIFTNMTILNVHNYKTIYNLLFKINCTYLSINEIPVFGIPIIKDFILNYKIVRHYNTFRQTNDIVKFTIHEKIKNIVNNCDNILLIGGECYVYAKILFSKYNICHIISDYDDIIYYANKNLVIEKELKNIIINKVSYDNNNYDISNYENIDYIIFNVRSLLNYHLKTIKYIKPKNIIIISCNDNNIKKMKTLSDYSINIINISTVKLILCQLIY